MSTIKPNTDKKGMISSLSADAAEFVPQCGAPQHASSPAEALSDASHMRWKGQKPVEVTEVPRYLTSCYPFVSPEDMARHHIPRFSQHCPYTGGMPPALPIPVTPPIRFPTWQQVKPGFVDNFQSASYGSMSFDLLASLPVDMFSVRGDGLLPIPSKMAVTARPSSGQGMLLTSAHPESASSWIMTVPPPMFLQQQQQLHSSQQQQHLTVTTNTSTTTTATHLNATASATRKPVGKPKMVVKSGGSRDAEQAARPQSPVLISRSTQTDLPAHVHNFTLEEMPHPLYVGRVGNDQSALPRSGVGCDGCDWKADHEDSDSGYNSPMHKQNLVSSGTQVVPSRIPSESSSSRLMETAHSSIQLQKSQENSHMKHNISTVGKSRTDGRESVRPVVRNGLDEIIEVDGKKKRRKKKDERYTSRSPRLLGSNTKLLSRSSSSLSSSGTRPDEDDEKIDLHSWTDFPPMSSRGAPLSASSKPLKSSLTVDERVPLMVERSAHEPPWSIKFSSVDQTRSDQSRSPSGEKDKILSPKVNLPPDSAWGKIGRSFKSSQASGLGKELTLLMTSAATVPLLNSGGRTRDAPGDGNTSTACVAVNSLKGPSMQTNRSNTPASRISGSGRGAIKHSDESRTNTRSQNSSQNVVNAVYKSHTDQGMDITVLKSTATTSTNPASSSAIYSSVSSTPLSSRPVAASTIMTTTTSSSSMSFAGGFATKTTTVSPYKDDALSKTGPHLQPSVSLPYTSPSSRHAAAHGMLWAEAANGVVSNVSNSVGVGSYTMSNSMKQSNENNQSGAANCSSFVRAGSVTPNQHASPSASSSIPLSSLQQQSTSFSSPTVVPVGSLRPVFPGVQTSINYHIPPPAQGLLPVHPAGSSHPHPAFTSYANITQGLYSTRATSPGFLTRGATSQTVHQVASPFQNSNVPFIPPPHTFAPSAPCPYFPGIVTYQPPGLHAPGMVPTSIHSLSDLVLQPPVVTAANVPSSGRVQKGSDIGVPSLRSTQQPTGSHASHCVSSTPKMADGTSSTVDTSVQQQFNHEQGSQNISDGTLNSRTVEGNDTRKRRRRKRTRGRKGGKDTEEGDGESDGSRVQDRSISNVSESTLHFEDMDEFPDLLTSASHGHAEDVCERATLSGTSVTYSDILRSTCSKAGRQSRTQSLTGSCVSGDIDDEDNASCHTGTTNESKRARKRRKRREQANKAAEVELAEISLEQQWLKEVGLKKSANQRPEGGVMGVMSGRSTPGLITDSYVISEAKRHTGGKGGDKKSQQPIAFDIAAMIDAIQKKPMVLPDSSVIKSPTANTSVKVSKKEHVITNSASSNLPGNMLDSSAPLQKRGKEREIGKSKKPSPLKKVILKEREQRKRLRLLDEDPDSATGLGTVGTSSGVGVVGGESELSQDALSNKSGDTDGEDTNGAAELSADFSPISQTSPISMSPASPGNSGVNSPITGSVGRDPVVMKIHSRRFREYCTQILDKEIDQCCTSLLQDLVKFQDRMYHKDPVKAKTKRRVVLGLREVTKHLKLKKIKCVVISPNLEKIQSKGGLDEALNNILNMCREQDVPFVFALGRRALGRACAKLVPVSVVGIFNYEGCESKYRSLISLTAAARTAYNEMVLEVEKEVAEYPTIASQTSSIGGVPGLFAAHMGHSRTPSGCSAISFTSSILSEPISENFPHAEPEVDSKGYEIVRDAAGNVVHPSRPGVGSKMAGHAGLITDIDDGNEADTEDFCEIRRKRRGSRPMNSVRFGDIGYVNDSKAASSDNSGKDKNCDANVDGASDDADERSTIGKLSRNVSELTLTNEDIFTLKGEPYAPKHKSSLQDFDDDREELDDDNDRCDDGLDKTDQENIYGDSESTSYNKWARVSHIDSIHSQSYSLGDDIFSHHSSQSHDLRVRGHSGAFTSHSQLSPSSLGGGGGGNDGHKSSFDDKDDDVDNIDNADGADEEEEENEAAERHHRVIDKERIKNWLESQSNISAED